MKKLIYSLAAFMIGISMVNANQIASGTAQTVASNYYKQNAHKQVADATLAYTEKSATGDPIFYVFNMNNKEGFVIVSAEDAGRPIIGYSTEGTYIVPSATSNTEFNFWMEKRKSEIIAMRTQNVQATSEISSEWNNYASSKYIPIQTLSTPVGPLVQTTWDQSGGGNPAYNTLCPGGSVTGCVATAMAQIMRYWCYPSQGSGASQYSAGSYGTLSANYASSTYNWANMPLAGSNGDVALIMYQAGVSVNMNYAPSGSGAQVNGGNPSAQYSFKTYFKYDPIISYFAQASYTTANWNTLLETEFAAGRPVNYEGSDPTLHEGHSWVCDGNDASDNMHMNWGWSGVDNGYYAVTNLVPPGQGIDFSSQLGGLFHIQPLAPTTSLDAGVFSISPPSTACNPAVFTPQVSIRNFGSTPLTSCTILYHLDNNTDSTFIWTGSLSAFQSTAITLSTFTVSTIGAHILTITTSSPNGGVDGNSSNDKMQTTLNVISNTATQTAPYVQGFETGGFPGADCYTTSSTSTQWNATTTAAYTGIVSMQLNNFFSTSGYVATYITPSVDMSATTPTLTFELAHAQLNSSDADQLSVYTSFDCGNTWSQRYSKAGATLANDGILSTAFTPTSQSQWRKETVNIGNVAGQTDVRFMFQFTNVYGAGNNIYIDDINLSSATGAGVAEEFANGFNLSVFPNPLNDNTTISFNLLEKNNVAINLCDVIGREVMQVAPTTELNAGSYTLPLNRNTLKSGVYFVKLNVNGYAVTKKIIVE